MADSTMQSYGAWASSWKNGEGGNCVSCLAGLKIWIGFRNMGVEKKPMAHKKVPFSYGRP